MDEKKKAQAKLDETDGENRTLYFFAACAALASIVGICADIAIGSIVGADLSQLPNTAIGRFEQFAANRWLGLYSMDLLNAITQLIMVPVYVAIYRSLKRVSGSLALLGLSLFLVGTAVFVANNSALPMLDLAGKYREASADLRTLYAAAGEAFLARGAHGSPGAFFSFTLPSLAGLFMSLAMLQSKRYSVASAVCGLAGNASLLVYVFLVTFVPGAGTIALVLAMPGGLLALAWTVMLALALFRFAGSRAETA